MSELKCCPFCGGEAKISSYDWVYSAKEYWIYCQSCDCASSRYHSKDEAIKAWNTRKPMANIVEKLEENSRYCVPLGGQSFTGIKLETAINIVKQEINKEN